MALCGIGSFVSEFVLLRKEVEFEFLLESCVRGDAADLERDRVPDGCVLRSEVLLGV